MAAPAPRVVATSRRVWRRTGRLATVEGMTLRFHDDGTFRVLQMADIQDGLKCYSPKTATITWSVLKNALEAARDENLIRRNPAKMVCPVSASSSSLKVNPPSLPDDG